MVDAADAAWVAGVDGCPGGWLSVLHPANRPGDARIEVRASFGEVLRLVPSPFAIAVDIPIGLPERATIGGRRADIEARSRLGGRQSAVFAVPARAAVMESDYRAACDVALAHSDPPRKVSKQTYNLFAKIREVDALIDPKLQQRVVECHPELAFWALNDERPLDEPKKVRSSPYEPGLALRRQLLAKAGYASGLLASLPLPRAIAGPDDLLDAVACAWTAARLVRGKARCFPTDPPRDGRGLAMAIYC